MIETTVPAPKQPKRGLRGRFSEVRKLEIGQSTTYPKADVYNLCSIIQYHRVKHGKAFRRRTEGDTIRVWRVLPV